MEHNEEVIEALADLSANNSDAKAEVMASYLHLGPEVCLLRKPCYQH